MKRVEFEDGEGNIVSIERARERYDSKSCKHPRVLYDEVLLELECQDCGEKLNPIVWMARWAEHVSRSFDQRRKRLEVATQVYEQRSKTKCQHCGKFTHIGRSDDISRAVDRRMRDKGAQR